MNFLEEKILKDGIVKPGNVLKVDSFINHQMDIDLFNEMGKEWKKRFEGKNINKILTIEASGIGIACIVAQHFGVPVVFAKKSKSINLEGEMYTAEVESFTHKNKNQVIVAKKFLNEDDHVLIIDDFGGDSMTSFIRDEVLMTILHHRMVTNGLTFMSSNLDYVGLKAHLASTATENDEVKASRIIERIITLMDCLELKDENYRRGN